MFVFICITYCTYAADFNIESTDCLKKKNWLGLGFAKQLHNTYAISACQSFTSETYI